jgi:hypothetical protein
MNNRDRILAFLQSIAPTDATNADIGSRTGIKPHQQVFMITRDLMRAGEIKGLQAGKEWRYWWDGSGSNEAKTPSLPSKSTGSRASNQIAHAWDAANSIDLRLGMTWHPIGAKYKPYGFGKSLGVIDLSQEGLTSLIQDELSPALSSCRSRKSFADRKISNFEVIALSPAHSFLSRVTPITIDPRALRATSRRRDRGARRRDCCSKGPTLALSLDRNRPRANLGRAGPMHRDDNCSAMQ